ncbi:MAG: transposase, partial [Candidatus Brocadiales bacterium]
CDFSEHRRRSIRLEGYNYSQAGAYFVTICTQKKKCVLGDVESGGIALNEIGCMVQKTWIELPRYYTGVDIDEFVIMPNHLHGIIILNVGAGPRACPGEEGQPQGVAPTKTLALPDIIYSFKSLTTKRYIKGVKQNGWEPFERHFWQRNYYEHVIRNEEDLNEIREYVINNPLKWAIDSENPANRL